MVVQMQVLSVDSVEMSPALMLSTETQRCDCHPACCVR